MDANLIAAICGAASAAIGAIVTAVKFSGYRSSEKSASPSARSRKLVSLGWGVCAFLATLIVVVVACQVGRFNQADVRVICGIGGFLFAVICVGTWVIG